MSKIKAIGYIFLLTVLPQVISISGFLIVLTAALMWDDYGSFLLMLIGLVAIITYQFLLIGLSVLLKSYGMSMFSSVKGEYVQYTPSELIKKTTYYIQKTVLGGISVRKREITQSGCLLSLGLPAIINSFTGTFKFFIETFRILISNDRQFAWDYCKQCFFEKKGKESYFQFMKMPIICCIIMVVSLSALIPNNIVLNNKYNINNVEITFLEKQNVEYSKFRIQTNILVEVANNGAGEISSIEGRLILKNLDGEELFSNNQIIQASFEMRNDPLLKKDEKWNIVFEVIGEPTETNMQKLWNLDGNDLLIYFDITKIWYDKNKVCKEFLKEEEIKIKNQLRIKYDISHFNKLS